MQVTALIRIRLEGSLPRAALRALLRASHRVRRLPGFRRWQTFRAMDASNAILVLLDWSTREGLQAAAADRVVREFLADACQGGCAVAPPEVLAASFDRQLTRRPSVATLLRLSQAGETLKGAADRDSDLALQALAAPGSTRLYGARNQDGTAAICRIDFDTEDGIWHFLESPLRKKWSAWAEQGREEELWALNLPRLECQQSPASRPASAPPAAAHPSLSLQLEVSEDGGAAVIRFQGRVDARGSARCEKLCQTLIKGGCTRLDIDVSGLAGISADALGMLTRTARSLKERGGEFVVIDNAERVKRVTRSRHLQASVR